jgi:hypothetical protein
MIRTIAALLAAATIAGVAVPATAQTRYYARERLMAMKKASPPVPVYTATYSSSYGACIDSRQSANITACKDSANKTVANSLCSAQTTERDCVQPVCALVEKGYTSGSGSFNSPGRAATAQAATDMCNVYIRPGQKGTCYWNASNNGEGPVYMVVGDAKTSPTANMNLWASVCG